MKVRLEKVFFVTRNNVSPRIAFGLSHLVLAPTTYAYV